MFVNKSNISKAINCLCSSSANAIISQSKIKNPVLNRVLLRRLSSTPGTKDSLVSEPIFEAASIWENGEETLEDLGNRLLHPRLINALHNAKSNRLTKSIKPYRHQIDTWEAASKGFSCLVTSGTGSGKTECFMIPILDSLLKEQDEEILSGIRAIIIYPLNALIESQRERLDAWTSTLKDRVTYALYNGLTPEKEKNVNQNLGNAEIGDRQSIRKHAPSILITNVTMLEYLLLRKKDQPIIEQSQGLLRWIILDEAHNYVGAQAAEMALLLRRVRSAFGVDPEKVQVIATSATISENNKDTTETKLKDFIAALSGREKNNVRVIHGIKAEQNLPDPYEDTPLNISELTNQLPEYSWKVLAAHPRIQLLIKKMESNGLRLTEISNILFSTPEKTNEAQIILDIAAQSIEPQTRKLLLPWRAHIFHRSLGGISACIDPQCPYRDPEFLASEANWKFGAIWLTKRDLCECGAPTFELVFCTECGETYLVANRRKVNEEIFITPCHTLENNDYAIDEEPDGDLEDKITFQDKILLKSEEKFNYSSKNYFDIVSSKIYPEKSIKNIDLKLLPIRIIEFSEEISCCCTSKKNKLRPLYFSTPFFIGNTLPEILFHLSKPQKGSGLPMGGRRAITFSDSRQGVARLAAKLQQDSERMLTRSFIYHSVQEKENISEDEYQNLSKQLEILKRNPEIFKDIIEGIEKKVSIKKEPITWESLVEKFSNQSELQQFCTKVWEDRAWGGNDLARNPRDLAEMFLYRELFRRPRVQNNVETMGLAKLVFPGMEKLACSKQYKPKISEQLNITDDVWIGLAYAAIDLIFRNNFAINIKNYNLVRWINPKRPGCRSIFFHGKTTEENGISWPTSILKSKSGNIFQRILYHITKCNYNDPIEQDYIQQLLSALWSLIIATAACDCGRNAWKLDFSKGAIAQINKGWLCPITGRIWGYKIGAFSPTSLLYGKKITAINFPNLPVSNAMGLSDENTELVKNWCKENISVKSLRSQNIWTDIHDKISIYPPFIRAQEHSAQIERPILQHYESLFKEGKINLLNCSTTMEMGIDIPDVDLVVNSNVPPSISNYRQRVGRAGRRGEPWAFGVTFCRDLPLDQIVFKNPLNFLNSPIASPVVHLDSIPIVNRHIHAALLGHFIRSQDGIRITRSIGDFFGATDNIDEPITNNNSAQKFLDFLQDSNVFKEEKGIEQLIFGTSLEKEDFSKLLMETKNCFKKIFFDWCREHQILLELASRTTEKDVRKAFEYRAQHMRNEFFISEIARRGFTPSYGFPVDVVSFNHLSSYQQDIHKQKKIYSDSPSQGGTSRVLNIAIREYAPGAEIVIDGLVHKSEGLLPAWSTQLNNASKLEDFQIMWECKNCNNFGIERITQKIPSSCPKCGNHLIAFETVKPAGFIGGRAPHTGYERLNNIPYEMPHISAKTDWKSFWTPNIGQIRVDHKGYVISRSSGLYGYGYALCLCCGRAEAEIDEACDHEALKNHQPLAPIKPNQLVRGKCPGGTTHSKKIKRNIHLIHKMNTDVFEFQLFSTVSGSIAIALAAALREALAERIGIETKEIGISTTCGRHKTQNTAHSIFLFDKSVGGSGFASRLIDFEELKICLEKAEIRLDCKESCKYGCPMCILRADMNFMEEIPDRVGALKLIRSILTLN